MAAKGAEMGNSTSNRAEKVRPVLGMQHGEHIRMMRLCSLACIRLVVQVKALTPVPDINALNKENQGDILAAVSLLGSKLVAP